MNPNYYIVDYSHQNRGGWFRVLYRGRGKRRKRLAVQCAENKSWLDVDCGMSAEIAPEQIQIIAKSAPVEFSNYPNGGTR